MKVKVYNDRVEVSTHSFDCLCNNLKRPMTWKNRVVNEDEPYMTVKQYEKTLSRQKSKLYGVKLDYRNCKFLTLGTDCELTWDEMEASVKAFMLNFKYKYGNFEYITATEHYENGVNRWHTHLILIFPNFAPTLNRKWLEGHWEYGRVDVRNLWAYKEHGLIHYLTKRKSGNINQEKPWLTKYPQFVKFIRTSRNLPMEEFYEQDWTPEEFEAFKEMAKERGARINNVGHYYGPDEYCLDKMFIEQAENVVSMI